MRVLSLALLGVVTTSVAAQTAPPRWTLSPAPSVTIDGTDQEFSRVLAVRVPSGEVVVLDGVLRELRLYGADGRFVKRMAGPGNGPGEIPPNNALHLLRSGDSLRLLLAPGIATPTVRTYTVRDGLASSALVRVSDAPRGGVSPVAPLGGGRWLVREGTFRELPQPRGAGETSPIRTILGLARLDNGGGYRVLDTLVTGLSVSYALAEPGRFSITAAPYASLDVFGVSGGRVWIGDARTGRIRILTSEGASVTEVGPIGPLRPFSESRVNAAQQRALVGVTDANRRALLAAQFGKAGRSARAPAFTRFVPGADGEMWVELFREDARAAAEYRVLSRDGRVIGAVTVPAGVRVEDVGSDSLLGTTKDEDDVPSVLLYRLTRR
jgi:hypothetical protein